MLAPSYHDLYVTTATIERRSIFNLPFNLRVTCRRIDGWTLSQDGIVIAGEYEGDGKGLRLDVAGHVIVDSL